MTDTRTRTRLLLDAWREQHADRLNPVRFHRIDALEQHAANHVGAARRVLDDRLARLVEAYANEIEHSIGSTHTVDNTTPCDQGARGALGKLVDEIEARTAARGDHATDENAAAPSTLPALDAFRGIWTRLRSRSQLRESLAQVPSDAGPLNSASLVHRSLTLMRELSPGYLQNFLSYVDALSWMEQMQDAGAIGTPESPRAASSRKRARGKPRGQERGR